MNFEQVFNLYFKPPIYILTTTVFFSLFLLIRFLSRIRNKSFPNLTVFRVTLKSATENERVTSFISFVDRFDRVFHISVEGNHKRPT